MNIKMSTYSPINFTAINVVVESQNKLFIKNPIVKEDCKQIDIEPVAQWTVSSSFDIYNRITALTQKWKTCNCLY